MGANNRAHPDREDHALAAWSASADRRMRILKKALMVCIIALSGAYILFCQNLRMRDILYARPYHIAAYTADDGQRLIPASMGYRLLVADFLWMRSIQAFGALHRSERFRHLYNLFFVITDVDPWFVWVYRFGALAMADEGGNPEMAVELLEKGTYQAPFTYRLPYEAAYTVMDRMAPTVENRQRALFFVQTALKRPDCPDHITRFRDEILSKAGRHEIAIGHTMRGLFEEEDKGGLDRHILYSIYRRRLLASVHTWQQDQLATEAQAYRERNGHDPDSVEALFEDNPAFLYETLQIEAVDEFVRYFQERGEKLMDHYDLILERSRDITREPPFDPRTLDDQARLNERVPYVVVHSYTSQDKERFIQSLDDAVDEMLIELNNIRNYLSTYFQRHGRLPEQYEAALPDGYVINREHLGGYWIYDPSGYNEEDREIGNAVFRSSTRPDL